MLFRSFNTKAVVAVAALAALMLPGPAFAKAHPTPAPAATPSPPPEDPAVTRVATREFVSWQAGNVDLARYSGDAKSQLSADKIAATSKALGQLGALIRSEWIAPLAFDNAPAGVKGYLYRMVCTEGAVYEQIVIDGSGKVTGIVFRDKLEQ